MRTRVKTKKKISTSTRKRLMSRKVKRKKNTKKVTARKPRAKVRAHGRYRGWTEADFARQKEMRQHMRDGTGPMSDEEVYKTLRGAFDSGQLVGTDDRIRQAAGLAPWSKEDDLREQAAFNKKHGI